MSYPLSSISYQLFETIPSTSDWAKLHLKPHFASQLTAIYADEQTKGRGQFNRSWISSKDLSLTATWVFPAPINKHYLLSTALGKLFNDFLTSIGCKTYLKWPNDLYYQGKKLGGILIEISPLDGVDYVICGLGINVNHTQKELQEIDQPANSISQATNIHITPKILFEQITEQLFIYLNQNVYKSLKSIDFHKLYRLPKESHASLEVSSLKLFEPVKIISLDVDSLIVEESSGNQLRFPLHDIKQLKLINPLYQS